MTEGEGEIEEHLKGGNYIDRREKPQQMRREENEEDRVRSRVSP